MKRLLPIVLAVALVGVLPAPSMAAISIGLGLSVNIGPPALPVYAQPPPPAPNLQWIPGYWAWGPGGYYWVPGTWVPAPQIGYLWTPGYWAYNTGYYVWHPGYWGPHVGFYGGINYGCGYFGNGFVGGMWSGNVFRYNTAVTNVNTTIIKNVYIDRTVINNTVVNNYNNSPITRVSYNGGPGGVTARPTPEQLAAAREVHVPMTPAQRQHLTVASRDRSLLATENGAHPAVAAAPRPFSSVNRPADFAPLSAALRSAARQHVVSGSTGSEDVRGGIPSSAADRANPWSRFRSRGSPAQSRPAAADAWSRFNGARSTAAGFPSRYSNRSTGSAQLYRSPAAEERYGTQRGRAAFSYGSQRSRLQQFSARRGRLQQYRNERATLQHYRARQARPESRPPGRG